MISKVNQFFNIIELEFINLAMNIMESDSEMVKRVMRLGYYFMERLPKRSIIIQAVFWICLGTIFGLGIGIVIG